MKYAWINRHRTVWPVSLTCEVLRVSASGCYEHERRDGRPSPMRMSDDALLVHIKAIHAEVRGEYGWPRIWKELLARGIRVGKDRRPVSERSQLDAVSKPAWPDFSLFRVSAHVVRAIPSASSA